MYIPRLNNIIHQFPTLEGKITIKETGNFTIYQGSYLPPNRKGYIYENNFNPTPITLPPHLIAIFKQNSKSNHKC